MWNAREPSPAERRDQALGRLHAWTTASVLLAGALVVALSVLAAGSFPGRGQDAQAAPAAQPADGQQPATGGDDAGRFQPPPGGFFGGGGGGGRSGAVSGGS